MKKHIISISGDIASGKGAVSKILKEKLNYDIYRNGTYFRQLAKEHDMDVTSFGEYVAIHPEIDKKIEKSASEYAKLHDNFIIDARLGWYVVPESFKVYLKVDIDVAAKRAFLDNNRKDTENFKTVEEQKENMIRRFNLENKRYIELYGVDKTDMSNYDLVIDTSNLLPEYVAEQIEEEYKKWLDE